MAASTLQQLVISLDTRIPLEAMILQRLYRLPQNRQNEWLRQLLLVGFQKRMSGDQISRQALPACAIPMSQPPTTETMVDHAVRSSGSSHNTERSGLAPQTTPENPLRT